MRKYLLIIAIIVSAMPCMAVFVINDANYNRSIDLAENLFFYEDPTNSLTFETATSEKFFRNYTQLPSNVISFGNSHCDVWVFFELQNDCKRQRNFFLCLQNPMIEELVFFNSYDSSFFNTGLRYPFAQRPDASKNYNFLVNLPTGQKVTYCIKFSAQKHKAYVPIIIKPGRQYFGDSNTTQALNGLVYAVALLTMLILLMLYFSEKDKLFLSALGLMFCLFLQLLWYDLTLFKFVVPESPKDNIMIGKILIPATMIVLVNYVRRCLPPKKMAPAMVMMLVGIIFMFSTFLQLEYKIHHFLIHLYSLAVIGFYIYCVISHPRKKSINYKSHVIVAGTVVVSIIYKNLINDEYGMLVYTGEHYVKIALLTLTTLSCLEFGIKFIKTRTDYYELNKNMEKSIKKRTEMINMQKEELNQQREELIQQKNAMQDQREELRAQKELLQLKNNELSRISQITNLTNNNIAIFTPDGQIDWFNAAFGAHINTNLEDYKNGPKLNILDITSNKNLKHVLSTCLAEKDVISYESELITESGDTTWQQTTLTPILNKDDEVELIISVDTNITQLKLYEKKIEQQKADAEKQRNLALLQKDEIESKQSEIFGSIRYAKRIQSAILPKPKQITRDFNDSFVLFMPKDIVSGDFYWYHRIDDKYFIAAVDCTGHGVPGAFLSIIGNYLLNSIVIHNGVHHPAEILKHLNRKIKISLKSDEIRDQNNDGMDIAIAVIDKVAHTLEFAGAMRPMYLYSGNEFIELKGDKIPITSNISGTSLSSNYTNYERKFNFGDQFYIFSDGIIDQFGGTDGKKYLTKRLKNLLDSIKDLPMKEQKELIKKSHDEWRGKYDQVDDITVIGIRYSTQDL